MNASRFVLVVALLATGCAQEGKVGAAGPTGPPGPQGPAGPVGDPPEILSISPESGSARTIWTIKGKNFAATAAANTVWFSGAKARVVSASATELVVTDAFVPVNGPETRAVSVEAANQLSNSHSVWAFPSGTPRERGDVPFWSEARGFAASADSIVVADAVTGVAFRQDRVTRAIERVAISGRDGLGWVERAFLGPMGETWISEARSTPNGMLWRLVEHGSAGWSPILPMNEPISAVAIDMADAYVVGEHLVRRIANGIVDDFAVFLGEQAFDAAFSGDFLFVTHPSSGRVSAISRDGEVSDLGVIFQDPRGIGSLGDGFVLIAANDGYHVATFGFDALVEIPELALDPASVNHIALVGDAELFFAADAVPRIMLIDANAAVTIAAAGIRTPWAITRAGEEILVGDLDTCFSDPATGLLAGAVLGVKDDGSARLVSSTACVAAGLAVETGNASAVYADALTNIVGRIDLATGTTTTLATIEDGILFPVDIAVGPNAEIYVAHFFADGAAAAIAKIDGAVTPDFALAPDAEALSFSVAVSGASLWMASNGALWNASLANGGDWMEVTPRALGLDPFVDALEPDGADGILLSDRTTGSILRYTASGELVLASTGSEWEIAAGPLSRNSKNGDLEIGNVIPLSGRPLTAMLP